MEVKEYRFKIRADAMYKLTPLGCDLDRFLKDNNDKVVVTINIGTKGEIDMLEDSYLDH